MPINQLNITFTAPQATAINGAYVTINTNFPFAVNVNKEESKTLKSIDNTRYPYVQRTMDIHIVNFPTLVNGFSGTAAEGQNDWTLMKQLDPMIASTEVLLEKLVDTRRLAAHELYGFLLNVYEMAKLAAKNNVPGIDEVVKDLAELFAGMGPQADVHNDPA
jgi:hypothetical protein